MSVYDWMKRGLFLMDAEDAHHRVMGVFAQTTKSRLARNQLRRKLQVHSDRLSQEVWGIPFVNPLGLAAGFDKDGKYFNALSSLGFGHIEIGTVTAIPQEGNPRPRLFRLEEDEALLNRMGFNNKGSAHLAESLAGAKKETLLGINIGKSKVVPLEEALGDYKVSLERVFPFADYLVVNVSSPNTPGLRKLQGREHLEVLLKGIKGRLEELIEREALDRRVPLLVKLSPDLGDQALEEALETVTHLGIDGIIATNTTITAQGLRTEDVQSLGGGGISGRPLRERSRETVGRIYRRTEGKVPIIGVGGIFDADDAYEMILAGASLIQIWTGFIYGGPLIGNKILRGLDNRLKKEGIASLGEIRGRKN